MIRKITITLLLQIAFIAISTAQVVPQRSFMLKFNDEITAMEVQGVFLLPNEVLSLETVFESTEDEFSIKSAYGNIKTLNKSKWEWKAPAKKGIYPVLIKNNSADSILLNCIVLVPYEQLKNNSLNSYKIGPYPNSNNKLYKNPKGFIEVTESNMHTLVTPNYSLKDFLCKQGGGYPKYIVLKERGIIKLEKVQAQLQTEGIVFEKFSFISGYRTPYYNKSIGNVTNSRHIYGDAFDIFIDTDNNSRMDDLNHDGLLNRKDALFLYNKVDDMYKSDWFQPFIGGLGVYGPNTRHGGFIHMDGRGYKARWGL